jgi:EAL domain-containing protein (putative c-di-GMP-specific phosphodiesterase class I)
MTVNRLQRTVLLLFVAVVAESLVAVVLRSGSIQEFANGNRSWTTLVALGGLGALGLLLVATLFTVRELLALWHEAKSAESRVKVLEASAMMARVQSADRPARVHAEIERDIVTARQRLLDVINRGNLTIAMQPIIDLKGDRWVATEALPRFPDGRAPHVWFREAEENGLGVELGLMAMAAALASASELPPHIRVSIDASPSLILDPRMAETIYRSGMALDRLTLGITEHAAVTAYDEIKKALLGLRERGVLLAVDDMGAGYASFGHVLKLRPDVIKLDRSMVADIGADPAKRAFVTALVLLALELDATVTADGVDTVDELEAVASLGVDHAQGVHIGRPDTSAATWRSWSSRRWMSPIGVAPVLLHDEA